MAPEPFFDGATGILKLSYPSPTGSVWMCGLNCVHGNGGPNPNGELNCVLKMLCDFNMDVWMALEIASLESYKPRSISFGCTILMN